MEHDIALLIQKELKQKFTEMISSQLVFISLSSFSISFSHKNSKMKIRLYEDSLKGKYFMNGSKVAEKLRSYLIWQYPHLHYDIMIIT